MQSWVGAPAWLQRGYGREVKRGPCRACTTELAQLPRKQKGQCRMARAVRMHEEIVGYVGERR